MNDDEKCYECKCYGDDYYFDDNGDLVSACSECPIWRRRNEKKQVDDKAELIEKLERMIEWFYHRYETAYNGDREMYYEGYNTITDAVKFIIDSEQITHYKDCKYWTKPGSDDEFGHCCVHGKQKASWFCGDGKLNNQ